VISEVFTTARVMFFWVLAPCKLVSRCQRFGETYCLHLQDGSLEYGDCLKSEDFSPEDGDSIFLRNFGIYLQIYTLQKLRTTTSRAIMLSKKGHNGTAIKEAFFSSVITGHVERQQTMVYGEFNSTMAKFMSYARFGTIT
jgi:hypothetical protein